MEKGEFDLGEVKEIRIKLDRYFGLPLKNILIKYYEYSSVCSKYSSVTLQNWVSYLCYWEKSKI